MKAPMTRAVIGIAALSLSLAGCGGDQHPPYSANIKFGLRQDPIIKSAKDLGEERYDPDRPGLLPIMKFDDALQPDHPYQAKLRLMLAGNLKAILEKKNANFANLTDEQKRKAEDEIFVHSKEHHAEFAATLDKVLRDPKQIAEADRKELETTLEKMFGTPAKPTINAEFVGIDKEEIKALKLDDETLAMGSRHYRVHCMHCHGVPGDGRGPTARWVNPHPRDFRGGMFKFQSVDRSSGGLVPPSRADLLRTLKQGIEGTAMPAFNILGDEHLEPMISYVMFLSLRGQAEMKAMLDFEVDTAKNALKPPAAEAEDKDSPIITSLKFWAKKTFTEGWAASNKPSAGITVVKDLSEPYSPEALAASVKRGQMIFTATPSPEFKKEFFENFRKDVKDADDATIDAKFKAVTGVKCISCHTDYGRQARFKYDEWGTLVRPNNFTIGIFRGGRRPVDIYYRIHSGIQGSEMTPFAPVFKGQERYLWDVVNFVRVMSYPAMHKGIDLRLDQN